jgi:hypothetical protein
VFTRALLLGVVAAAALAVAFGAMAQSPSPTAQATGTATPAASMTPSATAAAPPATASPSPAAPSPTATAGPDLVQILRDQVAASNAKDTEKVLSFFTDDGSLSGAPPCVQPCTGKVSLRKLQEAINADNTTVTFSNLKQNGNVVTGSAAVVNNETVRCGAARILQSVTATFRGTLITSIVLVTDPTDPETTKFLACVSRPPAPGAPSTGSGRAAGGNSSLADIQIIAGSLAIVASGLVLVSLSRRRRPS